MAFGPTDPRLLPAMMAAQYAPGLVPGPVGQQQLTPGFRAPGLQFAPMMGMPQQQQQQDPTQQAMGLMGMAAMMRGRNPNAGVNPGVPTPLGDPTGGAGPAYLGGTSPLGPADGSSPMGAGFFSFLKGLF